MSKKNSKNGAGSNGQQELAVATIADVAFPVIQPELADAFSVRESKPSEKTGLVSVSFGVKPTHSKKYADLAGATGLEGKELTAARESYEQQLAQWELRAMQKLVDSGDWKAGGGRVNGRRNRVTFALLKKKESKPIVTELEAAERLGISLEDVDKIKAKKMADERKKMKAAIRETEKQVAEQKTEPAPATVPQP